MGQLSQLVIDAGGTPDFVVVQDVFAGSPSTTIASIIYDSGTSGPCSIVLTIPVNQAACDALIRNTTVGPENARIIAVTSGVDGTTSIRLSTSATWAAGNTVQIIPTIRFFTAATHTVGQTLTKSFVRTAVTAGTGSLTLPDVIDLSVLGNGAAVSSSDYMHISMRVSDPSLVTELRVLIDVDATTNDFTRNYYWKAFRPSDLTPANATVQSLLATRTQIIQREIINTPFTSPQSFLGLPDTAELNADQLAFAELAQQQQQQQVNLQLQQLDVAISQQMDSGVSQWSELIFPVSELLRVGTDTARTLQNTQKVQIVAIVTGGVDVDSDSWIIAGGFGPDTFPSTAVPYYYRYRARVISTNVPSNFSPASRYAANVVREALTITMPQYAAPSGTSLSTADFVLDVERFGGEIPDWHYIGTIANGATPSMTDTTDDDVVGGNPVLGNNNYQPWPIKGPSVSGTTGTVSGTTVNDNATHFNASWAPGTRIVINGQFYTIYRVISTGRLEIVENAGAQTGVAWRIDEPTILAQPLPCLWEQNNTFFACGDSTNPGRLYFSNPGSETTVSQNFVDVTSPSEPLMNGIPYNVRSYVFSSENMYQVLASQSQNGTVYVPQKIPNGKGLFSRWALTREPSPVMALLSKDGIYITTGGSPISITDAELYPLFPNEGNIGSDVNTVKAPFIDSSKSSGLRITYYDEFLYFDYPYYYTGSPPSATQANRTLVMAFDLGAVSRGEAPGGWFYDEYTPSVVFHYGEEGAGVHSILCGGTDGKLYSYSGTSDAGSDIDCEILPPYLDMGDARENKLFGDVMLDADTDTMNVTVTPKFNNGDISGTATTVNTSTRALTTIPAGTAASSPSRLWRTARNISLALSFSVNGRSPELFIWEPRWTFEAAPLAALSWEISPSTFGIENFKHFGICKIAHVSTVDFELTFTADGTIESAITIPNSGGVYTQTIFRVPVYKAKMFKVQLYSTDSTVNFRLDPRDSFFQVKEWGSDGPYNEFRIFGDFAAIEG
jgi:hypothetical protein